MPTLGSTRGVFVTHRRMARTTRVTFFVALASIIIGRVTVAYTRRIDSATNVGGVSRMGGIGVPRPMVDVIRGLI